MSSLFTAGCRSSSAMIAPITTALPPRSSWAALRSTSASPSTGRRKMFAIGSSVSLGSEAGFLMSTLDLAAIGNCAVASLIDRNGRHLWYCFPRLDADPVFSALLGGVAPEQGFMDVVVRDAVETTQRYLPNTAVLETIVTDKHGGKVRIIDFAPRFERYGRRFRPPML